MKVYIGFWVKGNSKINMSSGEREGKKEENEEWGLIFCIFSAVKIYGLILVFCRLISPSSERVFLWEGGFEINFLQVRMSQYFLVFYFKAWLL